MPTSPAPLRSRSMNQILRLNLEDSPFSAALTAWITGASLPLLAMQLILSFVRGDEFDEIMISGLALLAMGSILVMTRTGYARAARILLPAFGFAAANAYLFSAENLTPLLFVANNATVVLLAGAVLSHAWVILFALATTTTALVSIFLTPGQWLTPIPSSHGWDTALPLFLFITLFIFLATRQRSTAQREAASREAELDMLREASAVVTASLDLNETIQRILRQLQRVVPYDSATVHVLTDGQLEIIGGRGWDDVNDVIGLKFPIPGDNPNTRVIESAAPYILTDAPVEHRQFLQPPHDHIRSWLGVPLRLRDQVTGMLSIDSEQVGRFTDRDAQLALVFGDAVAIALENARLFELEQRRRQQAAMQLDILQIASSSLELEKLLGQVAGLAAEAAQARFAAVYLHGEDATELQLAVVQPARSADTRQVRQLERALGTLGSSAAIATLLEERHARHVRSGEHSVSDLPHLLVAPLFTREKLVGALVLGGASNGSGPSSEELTLVETIGFSLAVSIENARLYAQSEQMAITDSLTGLYNRRGIYQLGQRELERCRRYHRPLSILMIDLDHFKQLNDQHGHIVGDEILSGAADRLYEAVRRIDVVGRYGGEEFLVLLPECGLEFALGVAERIRQAIGDEPLSCSAGPLNVTVSIGVSSSIDSPLDLESLIRRADQALYKAKQSGRDQVAA